MAASTSPFKLIRATYFRERYRGCHPNLTNSTKTEGARRRPSCDVETGRSGLYPKGTLGTGSAGLAVGGAYLAVAAGVDHLVAEFGIARQDAPIDRGGGGGDLAVAAQ